MNPNSGLLVPIFRTWGRGINGDTRQGRDWACPHCQRFAIHSVVDGGKQIVGFTTQPPLYSGTGDLRSGAVIVECPECFGTFWLHVSYLAVQLYGSYCPAWPKRQITSVD